MNRVYEDEDTSVGITLTVNDDGKHAMIESVFPDGRTTWMTSCDLVQE